MKRDIDGKSVPAVQNRKTEKNVNVRATLRIN